MLVIPRPFGGLTPIPFSRASWHPKDIPQAVGVYDISDLSSLFVEISGPTTPASVNGPVGTVLDLTGNGNDWRAPSNSQRPTLRSSGGLYWLEFDGTNDAYVMSKDVLDRTKDAFLITGGRWRATGHYPYWVGSDPLDEGMMLHLVGTSGRAWGGVTALGDWIGDEFDGDIGNDHVWDITWDHANGRATMRLDGSIVAQAETGEPTDIYGPTRSYLIGTREPAINVHGMVLLSGDGVAAMDKAQLRQWMAQKTGVTL